MQGIMLLSSTHKQLPVVSSCLPAPHYLHRPDGPERLEPQHEVFRPSLGQRRSEGILAAWQLPIE